MDDPTWAGGGYWIVKNSWGASLGNNNGYYELAYANQTRIPGSVQALEGPAYYTGTMYFSGTDYTNPANLHTGINATATWKGGTQQERLGHQHGELAEQRQRRGLHLGQPGSRGHLRQQHAGRAPSTSAARPSPIA